MPCGGTMARLAVVGLLIAGLLACEDDEPCDRYIDYMCSCHEDDPGFDCGTLENTYRGADADVQDECALELQDQKDADEANGVECPA